jgi:hypothetical protein
MRRGLRLAVASIGALVLSVVTGGLARAQSSGSVMTGSGANFNHSLKGTFSFGDFNGYAGYEPAVGTLTFDGGGDVSGTMDINVDGVVCTGTTLTGTYTVNSDKLTGTATLTVTNNSNTCYHNSTPVFPSSGTGVSLPLSLSLVRNGNGVVTLINMAEMDTCSNTPVPTFCNVTYNGIFSAVAHRTAK